MRDAKCEQGPGPIASTLEDPEVSLCPGPQLLRTPKDVGMSLAPPHGKHVGIVCDAQSGGCPLHLHFSEAGREAVWG